MAMQVGELFGKMGIDDKGFVKDLDKNQGRFEKVSDLIETPMVMKVDPTELAKNLEKAKGDVTRLKGEISEQAKLGADTSQLTVDLARAEQIAKAAKKELDFGVKATLDADNSKLEAAQRQAMGLLADVDGTTATGEADLDVSGVEDGVQQADKSVFDMIGGWAVAGPLAAAAAGAAIGKAFVDAVGEVIERGKEADLLGVRLDLDPAEAGRVGQITGQMFVDGWGESRAQLDQSFKAIHTNFGDVGTMASEDLMKVSEAGLTLSQVMGEEVSRTTRASGQLFRNGLAKDAIEGFDMILVASKRLPEEMQGELLDTIEEYGGDFKELGFTGEQAMAMITAAVQNGGRNTDLAADAWREFGDIMTEGGDAARTKVGEMGLDFDGLRAKILEGGPAANEATSTMMTALAGIENPVKRNEAGLALFGTKWLDLGADAVLAMNPATASLGEFGGKTEEAGRALTDNLGSSLDKIKRKLDPANLLDAFSRGGMDEVETQVRSGIDDLTALWDEYGPEIKEAVKKALDELGEKWDEYGKPLLEDLEAWWKDTAQPAIGDAIGEALKAAVDAGKAWAGEKLKDPEFWIDIFLAPLGPLGPQLKEKIGSSFSEAWTYITDELPEDLGAIWEGIETWVTDTGGKVKDKVVEIKDGFFSWVAGTVTDAPEKLGEIWDGIEKWVGETGTKTKDKVVEIKDGFLSWITDAKDSGVAKLDEIKTDIWNWATSLPGEITNGVGDLGSLLLDSGNRVIGGLLDGGRSRIEDLKNFVGSIASTVLDKLGDAGTWLLDAGNRIIGGLIDGVTSRINDLRNLFGDITSWIPDWKGPPERDAMLLFGAGKSIMGSLMHGIDNEIPALANQLGRVTTMTAGLGVPSVDLAGGSAYPGGVTGSPWAAQRPADGQPLVVQFVMDGRVMTEQLVPHFRVVEGITS